MTETIKFWVKKGVLLDEKFSLRQAARAAQTLEHRGRVDANAIEALSNLLFDSDPTVVARAALAIGATAPDLKDVISRFPVLLELLSTLAEEGWNTRTAVRALSRTGDPRAAAPLLHALTAEYAPDPKLYEPVRDGLIRIGKPAFERLRESLNAENVYVRELVVDVLAELGDNRAVEPLIQVLQTDDVSFVRSSAASALGKLRDTRATGSLIDALNDTKKSVRWAVVAALGEMMDKDAIVPLRQMLADSTPEIRNAAQQSLSRLEG
ncbi:MAG: HEAT repeat domain-containing protein [Aggregatilineales bacterium]